MKLEQIGITILLKPVEIQKESKRIWFIPELSLADIQMNYLSVKADMFDDTLGHRNVISYGQKL